MIYLKNKDALKEYQQYLIVEKGASSLTVENYIRDIDHFLHFLEKEKQVFDVCNITKDHIYDYLKMDDRSPHRCHFL